MPAQIKNAPARRGRTPKTEKPSQPTLTEASPVCNDRTPDGRFAKNNPGGPGNPHARHCARMLALLRASISDEEMVAIIRTLVEMARAKDVSAAKLLLSYKLGKPGPAPNPDEIDRDEWEHYQRHTINLQEVQQVLGSLPARVGNDIARTALPIVTQAHKEALASQLVKNLPAAHKPTKESGVAKQKASKCAPIPNGKSAHKRRAGQSTTHNQRSTTNDALPIPNGKSAHKRRAGQATIHDPRSTIHDQQSTIHDQRSTTNEAPPTPNRKSKLRQHGKTKPKKVKPEWLRQTARRIQKNGPANE
jgi:hypothetical protein